MTHGASAQGYAGTLLSLSAIVVVAVVHLIDAIDFQRQSDESRRCTNP